MGPPPALSTPAAHHGASRPLLALIACGQVALGSELVVFSDSAICVSFLQQGWAFRTWTALGEATRALYRQLRAKLVLSLYWIRGHAGIQGNEDADESAGRGAELAAEELSSAAEIGSPVSDYLGGKTETTYSVAAPPIGGRRGEATAHTTQGVKTDSPPRWLTQSTRVLDGMADEWDRLPP